MKVLMADMILLFNHTLTQDQKDDARRSFGVEGFVTMPDDVRKIWGQIPPHLNGLHEYLEPVKRWLADIAKAGDYVLIQGDFGATYLLVNYAKELQLKAIYATTTREAVEQTQLDGSVKMQHVFKHRLFRKYGE
jgi:hypothetical protein